MFCSFHTATPTKHFRSPPHFLRQNGNGYSIWGGSSRGGPTGRFSGCRIGWMFVRRRRRVREWLFSFFPFHFVVALTPLCFYIYINTYIFIYKYLSQSCDIMKFSSRSIHLKARPLTLVSMSVLIFVWWRKSRRDKLHPKKRGMAMRKLWRNRGEEGLYVCMYLKRVGEESKRAMVGKLIRIGGENWRLREPMPNANRLFVSVIATSIYTSRKRERGKEKVYV